ncbi:trypsin-like peptidase domain-containing protein [Mameliella alba]|uniref:Serine protease n=1 Tax=Mameliella alba TaxID=561184 RepID=A0A0B3RT49_9RHOB|nr:trypsin-like peptidase domain-containing protein [Mameliella alba]KHQ49908.1 N-acetylmuramoyl-L-alanine amidase, family 3 [Mameliella alba]
MSQLRRLWDAGLVFAAALALGGAAVAQGLPLFDGADFDRLVMQVPERDRDRIEATGAKPIIRYTAPTAIRRAGRAVGQVRVMVEAEGGPAVVACTGVLIAENLVLTAFRCMPGVLAEPDLAARGPKRITRVEFVSGFDAPRVEEQGQRVALDPEPLEAHADLGFVVLRADGLLGAEDAVLTLDPPVPSAGMPLAIVGHPFGTSKQVVREGCSLRGAVTDGGRLTHGCAALPGNAGAPVLDGAGRMIGLHLQEEPRTTGGRGVTIAAMLDASAFLRAVAAGEDCAGEAAPHCGRSTTAGPRPVDPETAKPASVATPAPEPAAPPDAEIVEPDEEAEDPVDVFPVGVGADGPAVYGVALPYLPPGTGIELLTGPLGDLDGSGGLLAAGQGIAATLTDIGRGQSALSLWRLDDGALQVRRFLPQGVRALALSGDGGKLALAREGEVEVMDLPLTEVTGRIATEGADRFTHMALSTDGSRVATVQGDAVSLWQASDGARLWATTAEDGPVGAVAFNAEGDILALAGAKGVSLHRVADGSVLKRFPTETPVDGLAFLPEGDLASGHAEGRGYRWNVSTGQVMGRIGGEGRETLLGPVGLGGLAMQARDGGTVRIYGPDGSVRMVLSGRRFSRAVLEPGGARLFGHVAEPQAAAVLADLATGQVLREAPRQADAITTLAFSPDSTRLALGGSAGVPLQVWAWEDGQVTYRVDEAQGPAALAWQPHGAGLAVQGAEDQPLRLLDFGEETRSALLPGDVRVLRFDPTGAYLARSDSRGQVTLLDAATGEVLRDIEGDDAAFARDGRILAVARNRPKPEIALIDPETGEHGQILQMPFSRVGPLGFRGASQEVVAVVQGRGVTARWMLALWNAEDGTLIRRFGQLDNPPHAMAVSPDGRFVAVAEEGSPEVLIWDMSVGRFLWRLQTGGAEVRALDFAPDGLRIAAALAPGGVVLWDMINGQVKGRLAVYTDGTAAQVGATLFLSSPAMLDRVAVRLPDGTFLPVRQVLLEGLPDFVPADLPLAEQVQVLLGRLREGDEDAHLLLVDGRALAFDLEFRKEMQRQLKAGEFYTGPIDGDIGRGSRRALQLFAAGAED